jgi:hypothetical protein
MASRTAPFLAAHLGVADASAAAPTRRRAR